MENAVGIVCSNNVDVWLESADQLLSHRPIISGRFGTQSSRILVSLEAGDCGEIGLVTPQ